MTDTATYTIEPLGPFSLAASARFIAGWPPGDTGQPPDSDIVRLAFVLDSFAGQAGASVREEHGVLTVTVTDPEHGPEIVTQAKRILSLNHDARDLPDVLARDPVAERRFQATGGLRPVLFHSPYEAAAWSIISARIQQRQGQAIRDQISRQFGRTVEVEGVAMPVFPTPDQLLAIEDFRGLTSEKLLRLHGVAEAALAGRLDPYRLRDLPDEEALAELQAIRGIGPFYAGLILIRATGCTDQLSLGSEPRILRAVAHAYGRGETITPAELRDLAERWRPYRTWITVLMRATA